MIKLYKIDMWRFVQTRILCDNCARFCPSTPDKCEGCEQMEGGTDAPPGSECEECGEPGLITCGDCGKEYETTDTECPHCPENCGLCAGTGIGQHGDPDTSTCPSCRGKGYFERESA